MNWSGIISIAIQLIGLVINCLMLKVAVDNRRSETGNQKDQKKITTEQKIIYRSSSVHDPPKKRRRVRIVQRERVPKNEKRAAIPAKDSGT